MKQTAEQSAIVDADVNEDLLVVAGAGSGKTMTMTSRIIALIRRGVPSEQILGLTFTRKAASELQSRVGAAVIRRDQGRGASGVDPERNFLKPTVSTYDAFFQSIVRQYGLLVGMDQDTRPLSSAGAYQLASQVVADHLDLIFPAGSSAQDGDSDDLGSATFSTTVNRVLGLTGAVTTSMISSDCPDFDQAVERIVRTGSSATSPCRPPSPQSAPHRPSEARRRQTSTIRVKSRTSETSGRAFASTGWMPCGGPS